MKALEGGSAGESFVDMMEEDAMTVEEFFDSVVAEVITGVPQKNDQRVGQWWFNRLHDVRPDVANEIRGSLADPFHRDDILNAFHLRVIDLW